MVKHSQLILVTVALMALAMWMDRQTSATLRVAPDHGPVGPISRVQAQAMGLAAGRRWGEPYPVVIGAAQSSTSDWLAQLKAHGEYINMGDQGDVWLVRLSGTFTPNRQMGSAIIHCQKMFVVIVVASGDIISAGSRMTRALRSLLILLLSALLAGCGGATLVPSATPPPTSFRSDVAHVTTPLPDGWAAVEGPMMLARPFTGLVAFNSWGQAGFWAPEIANGYDYGTVMQQLPPGGAYIVLIDQEGGPMMPPEYYGPEYALTDLSGLTPNADCRAPSHDADWQTFSKWGRHLNLEVVCRSDASSATVAAVNAVLAGWRFDAVPAGDAGWAVLTTRALLPVAVMPNKFPIMAGRGNSNEPEQTMAQDGEVGHITRVELKDKNILVTFTYAWSIPAGGSNADGRQHWWQYQVAPTGEVTLLGEGGEALP